MKRTAGPPKKSIYTRPLSSKLRQGFLLFRIFLDPRFSEMVHSFYAEGVYMKKLFSVLLLSVLGLALAVPAYPVGSFSSNSDINGFNLAMTQNQISQHLKTKFKNNQYV